MRKRLNRPTLSDKAKAEAAKPEASKLQTPPAAGNLATSIRSTSQKGITGKAIDKVKEVAKSATDIFSRVPCLPSKGAPRRWARCRMSRASSSRASRS